MSKTVVVGMSGGVDSSVAAALLKRQGYNVIGLFMKNWEDNTVSQFSNDEERCSSAKDFEDVSKVCEKIGIPYYTVNFVKEYWDNVFETFLKEIQAGYTPNPDVLCNREIKFNAFLKKAMSLGADYIATGHYARTKKDKQGNVVLCKALDEQKDQSYFLCMVPSSALEKTLFPLGDLKKTEVRELARSLGLATSEKKDSTGICFIGERKFPIFLSNYLKRKKGYFKKLNGEIVGEHTGVQFYTPGQRKGLGLGGEGEPWFVVKKEVSTNTVFVERGENHPALFANELTTDAPFWVTRTEPQFPLRCTAKIRYRQQDQECLVERNVDGSLRVTFAEPQRAIAIRQSAVFYVDDVCLGGAIISSAGQSFWDLQKLEKENCTVQTQGL